MIRYFVLLLFVATLGSRTLGLDLGLAPGISIKNVLLYAAATMIAIESALLHNRKVEILPVILPFALLIIYALMTWLVVVVFLDNPLYDARATLIRLKTKVVDQFLLLLVFFYAVMNVRDAVWLLKALVWIVALGCLITVVDSYNIPDLGIISARDRDGRIEGIIGDAPDFGGLLAFYLPTMFAVWWVESGLKRHLMLLAVGLAAVSMMLAATRGAMLGIGMATVLSAFLLRRHVSGKMLLRTSMAVSAITLVAALVVLSTEFGSLLESRLSTGLGTSDVNTLSSGRAAIWSAALSEMARHPLSFLTGFGWEAYFQSIGHRYATHSVYVDRFYNLGMIGLILFFCCYTGAISISRRALSTVSHQTAPFLMALIVGLIAYMIAMAFSDIHGAALYIWAYVGLALRVAVAEPAPHALAPPLNRDHTYITTRPTSLTPRV